MYCVMSVKELKTGQCTKVAFTPLAQLVRVRSRLDGGCRPLIKDIVNERETKEEALVEWNP